MSGIKERRNKNRKMRYFLSIVVILGVAIVIILLYKYGSRTTNSSIVTDENGEFEIELRYLGAVSGDDSEFKEKAEKYGYRLKSEGFTWWWMVSSEEQYEWYEERLSLAQPDFTMEFKKYYHILSFGRKLNKLIADPKTMYYGVEYNSHWEFDMTQYSPNTVYIYEIDFINLHDMEVDANMFGQNYGQSTN